MATKTFDEIFAWMANLCDEKSDFWACETLIREIIDRKLYQSVIDNHLKNILVLGRVKPGLKSNGRHFLLSNSRTLSLFLHRHSKSAKHLHLSPHHVMQALIKGNTLNSRIYKVNNINGDASIAFQTTFDFDIGVLTKKDGIKEILDFDDPVDGPAFLIRAVYGPLDDFEYRFDKSTLERVSISTTDPVASQASTICDLLAAVADTSSIDSLKQVARHPAHFLRWQAVQTIGAIDPETGIKMARDALSDPHPSVRQAARSTLDVFGLN